ncbi:hypothetical protein TKK_0001693 [Trichogramma kaykai]
MRLLPPGTYSREIKCAKKEKKNILKSRLNEIKSQHAKNLSDTVKEMTRKCNHISLLKHEYFEKGVDEIEPNSHEAENNVDRSFDYSRDEIESNSLDAENNENPSFKSFQDENVPYSENNSTEIINNSQLNHNEVMPVVDFSENYACKYQDEIQAIHFGASKKQLTLHTGVFYYKNKSKLKCVSFCTVSECLRHDAVAVWAHWNPVFRLIYKKLPNVTAIHFQSDGPTTQYKNKTNFQLLHHFCKNSHLKMASWNFTTPSHGKSGADGTGGTVKRLCNQHVLSGHDVVCVQDVIDAVHKSPNDKIHIFPIDVKEIEKCDELVDPTIQSAPNSQKFFQIIWNKKSKNLFF